MSLTLAIVAFLSPAVAEADLVTPPSIVCPRGTTFRRTEQRQEYCEPFRCDASGACPSGFECRDAALFVQGDRAMECYGDACPMVRVCIAPNLRELYPDEPDEPAPASEARSTEMAAESNGPSAEAERTEAGGCACTSASSAFGGAAFATGALLLAWARAGRRRRRPRS